MVKTWHEEPGRWTCEHCGAVYEVNIRRFPGRDADDHECEVCRKPMRWNSTESPSGFKLIERPDGT